MDWKDLEPYVPALIALGGVFVGAVLTTVSNLWLESVKARTLLRLEDIKAKAQRELEERKSSLAKDASNLALRRAAYVQFFSSVTRLNANDIFDHNAKPKPHGSEVVALFDALFSIEILSPKEVHDAFRRWANVICDQMFNASPTTSPNELPMARDAALAAARADIEIASTGSR